MDKMLSKEPTKITASGIVHTGPCVFQGFLMGTDGINDPTVTIYNNTAASGEEVVPTCTYDAAAYGLNGVTGLNQYCDKGLYIEIAGAGAVEIVVQHTPYFADGILRWKG
jgi:hypothetical protein